MNMSPRFQKLALLAHIAFSVGWFGAAIPYLALAIAGLTSDDSQTVRAAYLSMELIGWFVIVPFSFAALLSGLVQSLGTRWGLFRYWWVFVKFAVTVVAVVILFRHMETVSRVARTAVHAASFGADFRELQIGLLVHPSGGLLVLLAAMTLSVFKPWGLTRYGRRQASRCELAVSPSREAEARPELMLQTNRPRWARIIGFHAIGIAILFTVLHITGIHHH
jgi:hypothetical protein